MNILKYLVEATYNMGHIVDEIYRKEIEPVIKRWKVGEIIKLRGINIDDYIKELVDKLSNNTYSDKYETVLNFRQTERKVPQEFNVFSKEDKKIFNINLNLDIFKIRKLDLKQLKAHCIERISHELTHVFDNVRSDLKINHPDSEYYAYFKSELEFNALIHEIKRYAKRNPKEWYQINSLDELREFLFELSVAMKHFYNKNPNGYKNIEKRILKRLTREDLLPKSLR
jgi:hypothetical protein